MRLHGEKMRDGGGFGSRDYSEDETGKSVEGPSPERERMMSGESSLVWFTHLEMKSAPPATPTPCLTTPHYSADSQTTAPGVF